MVSAFAVILAMWSAADYENGPVRATVQVEPGRPVSVAESIKVSITTTVPAVLEAEMLATGNKRRFKLEPPHRAFAGIPGLSLKRVETPVSGQERDGTIVDTWTYVLEPLLPGQKEIPELTLVFWPTNEANIPLTIITSPVPFEVHSVVTGDPQDAELKPAVPVAKPKAGWKRWLLVVLIVALWGAVRTGYGRRRRARDETWLVGPQTRKNLRLIELNAATHPSSVQSLMERFVREKFGLEMSRLSADELRNHPAIPETAREQLAGIKTGLEVALYAKEQGVIDGELKTRIRQFLVSEAEAF